MDMVLLPHFRGYCAALWQSNHLESLPSGPGPTVAPLSCGMRCLVVDDDDAPRELIVRVLRRAGHKVAGAPDMSAAREYLEGEDVDVVLLDLEMPGMRGDEVMRAMKARDPDVRVLLMSGKPSSDLQMYLRDGADGVLRKPFGMRDLDDTVGAVLRA